MNASEQIDRQTADAGGWRGGLMAELRAIIHAADPEIVEEWKWETGVWTHGGMVCAVAAFETHVKINFFKGAALTDPGGIFNAGLEAKRTRAIDFHEGDRIDREPLMDLVRAAVALNTGR